MNHEIFKEIWYWFQIGFTLRLYYILKAEDISPKSTVGPAGATQEEIMNIEEKKSTSTVFFVAVAVLTLCITGFFWVSTSGGPDKKPGVEDMQKMASQVQDMEAGISQKQGEIHKLAGQFQSKTGARVPISMDTLDLGAAEKELLEQRIAAEKNISIKSLLGDILVKKQDINDLQQRIRDIEAFLPRPHIAQKGESHYEIAMDFLVNEKGLEKEKAAETLARTALFEELAQGFKIWNFYTGEEYGTSVTQGDAAVSPNYFVYRAKKKLIQERDRMTSERDVLAANLQTMESEQEQVMNHLDRVSMEKESLAAQVTELDTQVNSVFYLLDSRENLEKKGIIHAKFLGSAKLKDVSPDVFDRSLDLSTGSQLVIHAADLGMEKIKDISLYPRFYKEGDSYKVLITPDRTQARVTLLAPAKFKSERVVIAVKS